MSCTGDENGNLENYAELILKEAGGVLLTSDGSDFVFSNSFEKTGVIATHSKTVAINVVGLIKNNKLFGAKNYD